MSFVIKRWGLVLLIPFILGLKKGERVELQGYFNARYSANFLKKTPNVKFVLPPGTRARIDETKKFSSGNYGLKVEILAGPKKGEKVWVYYNIKNPSMKLYESVEAEGAETQVASEAQSVRTIRKTEALRIPAEFERNQQVLGAREVTKKIAQANRKVQETGRPGGPCDNCGAANLHVSGVKAPAVVAPSMSSFSLRASQDPPVLRAPTRTINPHGIRSSRCHSVGDRSYESCIFEGESVEGKFKLTNTGPNRIVSAPEEGRQRVWEFQYEGGARQDLGFSISDSPNGSVSQAQESYIMLFPRKTLPHIRVEGDRQIVTLPTGETVTFNKRTREVVGGVLTENGPITSGGKELSPAKVSYHGTGVMVRVNHVGHNEPRLQSTGFAQISKEGKICKVPVKDLWPDQRKQSGLHFKYFSDSDFDSYLKKKCSFGL